MEKTANRVAVVTGASRGLGFVIASVLAARGLDLVIGGREQDALDHAAMLLGRYGSTVVAVAGDVGDASVRERIVAAAQELGGLDILVNNASVLGPMGALMELDARSLGQVFSINAEAPLALIQRAVPLLAKRRGVIVNITSDAASGAYPGWGAYGASKAALELITNTLATELRDTGVSALLVDPGDLRTRLHQEAFAGQDISDRPLPDVTVSFWNWLFDQKPETVRGQKFAAQQKDARWRVPA
jgi:NAD(P)-dependent dehydrogenase (short-subunit alcohol dehydrogenase family)